MKRTERSEDYLKYIYLLSRTQEVHGNQLAETLGVSRPTVSVALKRLRKDGYIEVGEDHVITLTPLGTEVAEQVNDRHLIFEKLLNRLGVDSKVAHEDACDMEHTVSEESFRALKKMILSMEMADQSGEGMKYES